MEQLFKFNTKFLYFFSLLSFSHFFSPFSFLFSLFSFCKFTVHTYSTSPPFFFFSYSSLLSFLLLLLQIQNFSFLPDISSPPSSPGPVCPLFLTRYFFPSSSPDPVCPLFLPLPPLRALSVLYFFPSLLSGPCLSSISYRIFSLLMSLPLLLPLFLSVSFPWSPSS